MNNEKPTPDQYPQEIKNLKKIAQIDAKTLADLHKVFLDYYLNQIAINNELKHDKNEEEEWF